MGEELFLPGDRRNGGHCLFDVQKGVAALALDLPDHVNQRGASPKSEGTAALHPARRTLSSLDVCVTMAEYLCLITSTTTAPSTATTCSRC